MTSTVPLKKRLAQVFWLGFLVASLAYAGYSFYAPPNDIAWQTDPAAAQSMAREAGKPMVYFVTATWCSPCRKMKRQVWADDAVCDLINADFVPVLVDADDETSAPVLAKFGISGTPWTLFTTPEGDVFDYRAGAIPKDEFLTILDKAARKF